MSFLIRSLLLLSFVSPVAWSKPARVLIIRHAEKTSDKKNDHLSPVGFRRAEALKNLFLIHPEYAIPRTPDFLFAAAYRPGHSTLRSIETLTPLAENLNLQLQVQFSSEETADLAQELLSDSRYDQQVILIAWKHSKISNLAAELMAPCADFWKSETYDRVWIIDYLLNSTTCKDVPQSVLPGDSSFIELN